MSSTGIVRDITKRKSVEAEFAGERSKLEETVYERTRELRLLIQKLQDVNLLLEQANHAKNKFLESMSMCFVRHLLPYSALLTCYMGSTSVN